MECVSVPRMSDEEKDQYVQSFALSIFDPRPPGVYQKLLLPAAYFIPSKSERQSRGSCYKYTGAPWLRVVLKLFPCYPRTIQGTQRDTVERERALILTVPLTIKYEVGHVWGGLVHTIIATIFLVLSAGYVVWGCNYIIIYFVHVLPCCVQRMNRSQLYAAIEDFRTTRAGHAVETKAKEESTEMAPSTVVAHIEPTMQP